MFNLSQNRQTIFQSKVNFYISPAMFISSSFSTTLPTIGTAGLLDGTRFSGNAVILIFFSFSLKTQSFHVTIIHISSLMRCLSETFAHLHYSFLYVLLT